MASANRPVQRDASNAGGKVVDDNVELSEVRQWSKPKKLDVEVDDQGSANCDITDSIVMVFESEPVPPWREQVTFRALVVSFFLAVLFNVIVMKLSLTTGIIPSLNVSAGLLGFFFLRVWTAAVKNPKRPFTRQENTVIQTCVAAPTASPSAVQTHFVVKPPIFGTVKPFTTIQDVQL